MMPTKRPLTIPNLPSKFKLTKIASTCRIFCLGVGYNYWHTQDHPFPTMKMIAKEGD